MKLQLKLLVFGFILYLITISNFNYPLAAYSYGEFKPSSFSADKDVVLVAWNSDEGLRRLSRATYKDDYYQLTHHYQPQINLLYCGIASSVIVLNAMRLEPGLVPSQKSLEVKTPQVWGGTRIPFREHSQITFLNEKTDKVKPREIIDLDNITAENTNDESKFSPGLTLAELKGILEVYDLTIDLHYAAEDPKEGTFLFRQSIKTTLSDRKHFLSEF